MTKPKQKRATVMGFKAEPALREQIERLARAQERSQSWVIRGLLLRALAQNEKTA